MKMNPSKSLSRCALSMALLLTAPLALAEVRPFDKDSLAAIAAERTGEDFLLVLWSLHCAPCFAELQALGTLLAEQPQLPVVLVAADSGTEAEDIEMVLEDYGLQEAGSWLFADPLPERLRHAIDPDWYGELPRSYLYRADGTRVAHSGMLTEEALRVLLDGKY